MSQEFLWKYRYSLPRPPKGDPGDQVEITAEQAEQNLLARLEEQKEQPDDALWQLARFYSGTKRHEQALGYLRRLLERTSDCELSAGYVLAMGQTMEAMGDYDAAIRFYREGFAREPVDSHNWYFLNNNLGFSLNTQGRFAEGEGYCRAAILIEPARPNAHKNLGIALAGQDRHREAARCFVQATKVNASDGRSLKLLQELLLAHAELGPEFEVDLACCQEAVQVADEAFRRTQQR